MLKTIFIFILIPLLIFSNEKTYFSPDVALYNESILNIPPIKIDGFILGILKENFEIQLYKKYKRENIVIQILKKDDPKLIVYKVDTQTTEHYIFYIYGNILGKIKIINLRPFEEPEIVVERFVRWYQKPYKVMEYQFKEYENKDLLLKRYVWKRYYKYTPQFSRIKLDMLINISLQINIKIRFVEKIIYGYSFDDNFLALHFGTRFDW